MIDVKLVFIYIFFKILVSGNGIEYQGMNTQKPIEDYNSTKLYEANPIILDDILHEDTETMIKEKDGSSRQRRQLLPNLFKGSLDTGLLFPVGINAQLGTGIKLPQDQSIIPNLKVNCGIPETLTPVPYPVKLSVVNPQDIDKKLCDTNIPNTLLSTLNPISKIKNGVNSIETLKLNNQLESNQNLNSVPIKPFINTIVDSVENKSHDIINNTPLQLDNEESLNVAKHKDLNLTLLSCNKANTTESSLTNHKDDYFLKNEVDEKPLISNCTELEGNYSENNIMPLIVFLEPANKTNDFNRSITIDPTVNDRRNDSLQNKLQPLLIPEDKKTTLNDNCETQTTDEKREFVTIENAKPGSQYINPFLYMETKYQPKTYGMDCNTKNYGLYYYDKNRKKLISVNKPYNQYIYPTYFDYRYLKPVPENSVGYDNYLHNIDYVQKNGSMYDNTKNMPICGNAGNENRNMIQEYTNIMPAFKHPIEAYQYRKPDTNTENIKTRKDVCQFTHVFGENRTNIIENHSDISPELIYPTEYQNTHLHHQPKIIPVYYKFINQEYENIRPEYSYPFEHKNINTQKYGWVENLAENHRSDSNVNAKKEVFRKENSDASMTPRKKLYYLNNKPSYGMVNLNYGNAGKLKRIQYCYNQHYPFISCNGFYINRNIPRTYPSYFIYPYAYVNGHF